MVGEFLEQFPIKIDWKRLLLLVILFLVIVLFLRTFIFKLTPFFLALVVAALVDRPVSFLSRKIPRFLASLITLLILFLGLTVIIIFIITSLIYELVYLSSFLPEYREQIIETITRGMQFYQEFFEPLPVELLNIVDRNLIQRGEALLSSTVSSIVEGTVNITGNIPGLVIFAIFMVITGFFLSKDKEKILTYFKNKIDMPAEIQSSIASDVLSYLKVQLLIMTNSTVLTGIAFYFLGFPYAILLALSSGILELIPVVGPGGILWPLMVYNLFFDLKAAIILFVIYLVISGIRPIFESKILGSTIGIHPVILLFGMYVGLMLLGVQGVILAPISLILFKAFLNNDLV